MSGIPRGGEPAGSGGTRRERAWRALGPLLTPLSWPYAAVVVGRRWWWQGRARSVGRPVVSVGNITCGGTGKTPTVEMVVRDLLALGRRPAILSRGYGSQKGQETGAGAPGNDEFRVLASNLPDVPHYQGADRWQCGRRAITEGADTLVLDDGFQHVRLERDLDIVLLDALDPFGRGRLLPAGPLREPIGALRHAQIIGITRTDLQEPDFLDRLTAYLADRFPGHSQLRLRTRPLGWFRLDGGQLPVDAFRGLPALGICGIGNPEAFRRQLLLAEVELCGWMPFLDHHRYTRKDVERAARSARELGAEAVLMTQKDAVKLTGPEFRDVTGSPPWLYLKIAQTIATGEEVYREALRRLVTPAGPARR